MLISLMLPNHSITFWVFFHWFSFKIFFKLELILSRMILLGFPDPDRAFSFSPFLPDHEQCGVSPGYQYFEVRRS